MQDTPSNPQVAAAFEELAQRLSLIEPSPYRWMAYRRAAQTIAAMQESAALLAEQGTLHDIPGLGSATVEKVVTFARTGSFPALDRARAAVPDGLLELTRVPGVGAKTATTVWTTLAGQVDNLRSFDDVQHALLDHAGSITGVRASLLEAIAEHEPTALHAADAPVRRDAATAALASLAAACGFALDGMLEAGGLTRGDELVDEVVVVVSASEMDALRCSALLADRGWRVTHSDDDSVGATAASGAPVRVLIREPEACARAWVDELGEDAAQRHADTSLVSTARLRADLHTHTDWSDGADSMHDMVHAAMTRGVHVYAVTDHSAPYAMVNGLDARRLAQQRIAVAELQAELGAAIDIWCGSEVEVLADGSLGLDDATLEQLDWVVASIHTRQRMSADELRARYERVLSHPLVDCIGHPTGRLLQKREPMAVDLSWLIDRAASTGTMLELNANPRRLDLSATHAAAAVDAGVPIAINTDAHNVASLDLREHGVAIARRAGLMPQHVVNCWSADEIQARRPRNR